MKEFGGALFGLGILLVISALFIDPSISTTRSYGADYGIPDRIVNIQRLQIQMMIFQGGLGSIVAGAILYAVGRLIERMEMSGILKKIDVPAAAVAGRASPSCDWCDQAVPAGRKPCSATTDEKLREVGPSMTSSICRERLLERGLLDRDVADA